ncbi:hypothetical protein VTJ04DRAFT_7894 [Mycothermus thermophilus]|uniref:uncharacterized protein n=1 Tax=Humicola insolens TaxID=85995 RepID=UPI003744270C
MSHGIRFLTALCSCGPTFKPYQPAELGRWLGVGGDLTHHLGWLSSCFTLSRPETLSLVLPQCAHKKDGKGWQ